jgi:hypothetical protein
VESQMRTTRTSPARPAAKGTPSGLPKTKRMAVAASRSIEFRNHYAKYALPNTFGQQRQWAVRVGEN